MKKYTTRRGSPEWRAKLSAAHKGRKRTPEHEANRLAALRKVMATPEYRLKKWGSTWSQERANESAKRLNEKAIALARGGMPIIIPDGEERLYKFRRDGGYSSRNYVIPPDLMPRSIEVRKSSVLLTVAGEAWNPTTRIFLEKSVAKVW